MSAGRAEDGVRTAEPAHGIGVPGVDGVARAGVTIEARAVSVVYGGRAVVSSADLAVPPGLVLAVTGPSGAGKTSLLWALAGLQRPSSGSVVVHRDERRAVAGEQNHGGRSVLVDSAAARGRDAFVAAGVVVVPQGNALATVLTAIENVVVPLVAAGVASEIAHAEATRALEAVGLAGAASQLVEELSGGQQQRVAVARGLAQRGAVLLADEPTSELDAVNRGRVVELLREEALRGAAVVMATHDPEAASACDGELHLDDGVPAWVRPLPR